MLTSADVTAIQWRLHHLDLDLVIRRVILYYTTALSNKLIRCWSNTLIISTVDTCAESNSVWRRSISGAFCRRCSIRSSEYLSSASELPFTLLCSTIFPLVPLLSFSNFRPCSELAASSLRTASDFSCSCLHKKINCKIYFNFQPYARIEFGTTFTFFLLQLWSNNESKLFFRA